MNDRLKTDNGVDNSLALDRQRVRASFDRAAGRYDQAASLQRRAAERLLVHVGAHDVDPTVILDAGCGTGYGARLLAAQYPDASLYCLDIASSMLVRARHEAARDAATSAYLCADATNLPLADASIDLLCSNAMLQWCDDLQAAFAGFERVMAHGGLLAFSTFGPGTLAEVRAAFDDGYTHVSRFADVPVIEASLHDAGFSGISIEHRRTVLHYPDVRTLMHSLKTIGAGNATAGRARGLTGKVAWQAMCTRYETLRAAEGLPVTYELIYVTARKDLAARRSA